MMYQKVKHRWRYYVTAQGRSPVRDFLQTLQDRDAAEVFAAMKDVQIEGLQVSRHLRGEIYEVRVSGSDVEYRVLFSSEGKKGRVLLALESFKKKTQRTPPKIIGLAERRLLDWRSRRK